MKESMRSKLKQIARRLEEIDAMLASPEATNDMNRFRDLSRERAEIEPVVMKLKEYESTEGDIKAAQEMLQDPESADFAQEEIDNGKERLAALEKDLQIMLLPRDPNDSKNIVAIKEASGNLEQVDEIIKNKPSDFDVLSGDDALTFSMVASGAAGAISVIGNALPKEFSRMIRLEFKGEYEPARKIHHSFTELYSLLFVDGNPAGVKALLHEMGFIENVLRLPLVPTRLTTLQKITRILKALKL